jgi:aminopeptidase-like protein
VTTDARVESDPPDGERLYELVRELYPICRSITGEGVRRTLAILATRVPLTVHEVPSQTPVLDWTVPLEWNVRDAYVASRDGRRVIDFQACNLHLLNYSRPMRGRVSRDELHARLFSLPDHPDWIPYRTSYYADAWGFCVTERQRAALQDDEYDVVVDTSLEPGSLTYGEVLLRGESRDEVFLSAHVCHPSLANDNLSGIVVLTAVIEHLRRRPRRLTYRIVFAPGTIGAITWLAQHPADIQHIRHGLVIACIGDPGPFTYKRSRRGDAEIDRAVAHVLGHTAPGAAVRDFSPDGYDERQYCSPGFNLPFGRLTRTPNGEYPQYHTSADDLTLVTPEALGQSAALLNGVMDLLDANIAYSNLQPYGEPQLGRRGFYRSMADTTTQTKALEEAGRWVLNFSDGRHTLLDIAERAGLPFGLIQEAAQALVRCDLLAPAGSSR